ncbi:MAG: hypothetical protein ACSLFQ_05505 [Thermoanaerobaculia bacterium]
MSEIKPLPERTELLLRIGRRGLMVVLVMFVLCGATVVAHAVRPGSLLADWPSRVPWLIPVAIVLAAVALNAPLGKRPWRADGAEEQAILEDEFRQANLSRAQRITLIALLVAQLPIALVLMQFGGEFSLMAMAVLNIALGMATLIASFLVLDRE